MPNEYFRRPVLHSWRGSMENIQEAFFYFQLPINFIMVLEGWFFLPGLSNAVRWVPSGSVTLTAIAGQGLSLTPEDCGFHAVDK